MKLAIIFNNKNEAALLKSGIKPDAVLCFLPDNRASLNQKGYNTISSAGYYSDCDHAKTAVQMQQLINYLGDHREMAGESMLYIFSCSLMLYKVMRKLKSGFQNFIWFDNAKTHNSDNYETAYQEMLKYLLDLEYAGKYKRRSNLHLKLLEKYNRYLTKKLNGKNIILLTDGGRAVSRRLANEIAASSPNSACVAARTLSKGLSASIRHILRSLKLLRNNKPGKHLLSYFFYAGETKNNLPANFFENIRIADFALAKPIVSSWAEKIISSSAALAEQTVQHTKNLNPKMIVTDSMSDSMMLLAAKTVKESGGKVLMFNHGTHSAQPSPISKLAGNMWASANRIASPYATHILPRSPEIVGLVEELYPKNNFRINKINLHSNIKKAERDKKFVIVYAANYLQIKQHIPWITETPDALMESIAELAEAVSKIPDAHLIIRLKAAKSGLSSETAQSLLPKYANVEINNKTSFRSDLKRADLLVSNLSATIDEAIQSAVPVLLHSKSRRYHHLKSMLDIPNKTKRSAVYGSSKKIALIPFLEAIIAAHKNSPLTDDELREYIWPPGTESLEDFAKKQITGINA